MNVYHFVPQGWERSDAAADPDDALADELHFLYIAAKKTENIREDLGSAGDVIAAQVEQKMLGRRTDWQTADVEIERRTKVSRAELRIARDLARDLQRLTETLHESRGDLNLTPQAVEHVVRTALKLAFNKDLTSAPGPDGFPAQCFRVPDLPGTWAQARNEGLYHPVTGKERPVTFDHAAAAERSDVVLLHLGHHLVEMCLRLLRAELWATARRTDAARLHRVTARIVPTDLLRVPAVLGHIRVVVTGAEGTRLHEEVVLAGGTIEAGKLVRAREDDLRTWLAASEAALPPEHVTKHLAGLGPALEGTLSGYLDHRSSTRRRSLEALIKTRCTEEVAAMTAILDELEPPWRTSRNSKPVIPNGSGFHARPKTISQRHAEWSGLLRPDGPFIAVPVLAEAFPQYLDTIPDDTLDKLRLAWTEVCESPDTLTPAWCDLVLRELLAYTPQLLAEAPSLPPDLTTASGRKPDAILYGPDGNGGRAERLLVYRRPHDEPLTRATRRQQSPAEQAAALCRDRGVPLALLTNGAHWVLVHARPA